MRRGTRWAWGLLAGTVLLTGCNKIQDERTVSLDNGVVKELQIDAQKSDLKVTVTGQSGDVPVNAALVLQGDEDASMEPLEGGQAPPKALASALGKNDFTLEATLPANKGGTVMLSSNKKADVKVKIVGK